jgi:hypothetical protein
VNDLLGRVGNGDAPPRLAHAGRGAFEQSPRVAEERLAARAFGRRGLALKDDVTRDAADERAVPVKRHFAVGVEIVLRPRLHAQLVDLAEVPLKHLAETPPELRQRVRVERREPARHDHAAASDPLFEEARRNLSDVRAFARRADDHAEGFERFECPSGSVLFTHGSLGC